MSHDDAGAPRPLGSDRGQGSLRLPRRFAPRGHDRLIRWDGQPDWELVSRSPMVIAQVLSHRPALHLVGVGPR
jgi:hypothetical protein